MDSSSVTVKTDSGSFRLDTPMRSINGGELGECRRQEGADLGPRRFSLSRVAALQVCGKQTPQVQLLLLLLAPPPSSQGVDEIPASVLCDQRNLPIGTCNLVPLFNASGSSVPLRRIQRLPMATPHFPLDRYFDSCPPKASLTPPAPRSFLLVSLAVSRSG